MTKQPTGTVTFLFTDIEGSTKLWEHHPEAMQKALARHDELLRQSSQRTRDMYSKPSGMRSMRRSISPQTRQAALFAQRSLLVEVWGETPIKVRMALHTGTAEEREETRKFL